MQGNNPYLKSFMMFTEFLLPMHFNKLIVFAFCRDDELAQVIDGIVAENKIDLGIEAAVYVGRDTR